MLFPDRREPVGAGSALQFLARLHRVSGGARNGDPLMLNIAMDAADAVGCMHNLGWHYPVLVVFRGHGEERWSHATVIGRSQGEEGK